MRSLSPYRHLRLHRQPGRTPNLVFGMTLPLGTRVTYDDMPVLDRIEGTVASATAEELQYAKDRRYASQGVGPDAGDVLVQWDGDEDWDRSWEHPSGLRVLPGEA